ncbi:MAG TPA: division/cell wall cluster transcriptional repressor MraZ [Bacteroidetes bacterium]|nr:division/cell wall cluster transcriptional repressor MraZ [Bacteroidota bacterium]
MSQTQLIGEYEIYIDAKGRVMIPAALKRQLPAAAHDKLVINRGVEKCLSLYPFNEWQLISHEMNKLNLYVKDNRDFARYFFRGATELQLDASNRILIPKPLLEYAGIEKEIVLFAYSNRIEVWSKKQYHQQMDEEPRDFVKLSEQVMGKVNGNINLS